MTNTSTARRIDRLLRNLLDEIEGSDDPSFTEAQRDFLERRFFEIHAACDDESTPWNPSAGELHKLLAERNQIAIIWDIEDVQTLRPDLGDEQAWQVLEQVERHHDAGIGIHWEVLEIHAQVLFPEPIEEEPIATPSKGINP